MAGVFPGYGAQTKRFCSYKDDDLFCHQHLITVAYILNTLVLQLRSSRPTQCCEIYHLIDSRRRHRVPTTVFQLVIYTQ
jgi:hypothetical protein